MAEEALAALRKELGGDPPPGVSALGDDEVAALASAVHDARRRQTAALAEASERALDKVPGLLRGAVRRALR